jgi:hypothetical protein
MPKLFRRIDDLKLISAKDKDIATVMAKIEKNKIRFSIKKRLFPKLIVVLAGVFALFVIINSSKPTDHSEVLLNSYNTKKIAELSYLTGNLISVEANLDNHNFLLLTNDDTTSFELEEDNINVYFDMLKVYLEDDFSQNIKLEPSDKTDFDYLISFDIDDNIYKFYLNLNNQTFNGVLYIGSSNLDVTGTMKDEDGEMKLSLEAYSGNDFVKIDYKYENEDEMSSVYSISSSISNVQSNREIKVTKDTDESKVVIKDNGNEYTLKKEFEDGSNHYKIEYNIEGIKGEAKITEVMDSLGNVVYQYSVKEGNVEKEIEHGRPSYDFNQDNNESDNHENDHNTGKPDNQSNNSTKKYQIFST